MDTRKLVYAINDLCEQRDVLTEAIDSLRKAVITLQGPNGPMAVALRTVDGKTHTSQSSVSNGHRTGSHLDNVLKVLAASGSPMHIMQITSEVGKLTDKEITRASIDGAVSRHIRDSKHPQITRIGAGQYALIAWGPQRPASSPRRNGETSKNGTTRKDSLASYLKTNGPTLRKDLLEHAGMPSGTIAACLNDKERFRQLDDGRWDVVTA
jgi:hypothetical protein